MSSGVGVEIAWISYDASGGRGQLGGALVVQQLDGLEMCWFFRGSWGWRLFWRVAFHYGDVNGQRVMPSVCSWEQSRVRRRLVGA